MSQPSQSTPLVKPGQIDQLPFLDANQKQQYKTGLTALWKQYETFPQGSAEHQDAEQKIRNASMKLMAQITSRGRPPSGGAQSAAAGAQRPNQPQGGQQAIVQQASAGGAAAASAANQLRPNAAQQNLKERAIAEVNSVNIIVPPGTPASQVEQYKANWRKNGTEILLRRAQRIAFGQNINHQMAVLKQKNQPIPPDLAKQMDQCRAAIAECDGQWSAAKARMQQLNQQHQLQQQRSQQQNPNQPQAQQPQQSLQLPPNAPGQAAPQAHPAGGAPAARPNAQQRPASASQQPDVKPKLEPGTAATPTQQQGISQSQQGQQQAQPQTQTQQQTQPLSQAQVQPQAPMQPQPQQQTQAQPQPPVQASSQPQSQLQQQRPPGPPSIAQQQQSVHNQQPPHTPSQAQSVQSYSQQNNIQQPSGQPPRPHINTQVQGQMPPQQRQGSLTTGIPPQGAVPQNPPQSLSHQAAMSQAAESYQRSQAQAQAQAAHQHPQQLQHPHPQQSQIPNGVHYPNAQQPQSAVQQNTNNSAYPNLQTTPQSSVNTKFPIPKTLALDPRGQAPVSGPPSRPTLPNQGMLYNPGVQRAPPYTLEGEGDRVLSKRKLDELVRQITGSAPTDGSSGGESSNILAPEVEESVMQCADDFVDDVITAACRLAKLRPTQTLDIRDIQIVLERNYGIRIPGYSLDEVRTVRKFQPAPGWQSKMQAIQAGKVMGNRDA